MFRNCTVRCSRYQLRVNKFKTETIMRKIDIDEAFDAWLDDVDLIDVLGDDIVSMLILDAYNGIDISRAVQNRIDGAFDEHINEQVQEYELARAGI